MFATLTPKEITPKLKAIASSISNELAAYIDITPEVGAEIDKCHDNTKRYVERNGGTIQYGWAFTDPPFGVNKYPWQPKDLEGFTRNWATGWNKCGADFAVIFWSDKWLFEAKKWFDESLSNYRFVQLLHVMFLNNSTDLGSGQCFRFNHLDAYFYVRKGCTTPVNGSARGRFRPGGRWNGGANWRSHGRST